jgi:hypothetical protein
MITGVALDIGAGHGALIVRTSPERAGAEIEVVREADSLRTHVGVRAHQTAAGVVHAAVFGSLPAGVYRVLGVGGGGKSGGVLPTVMITGGSITELYGVDPG